MSPALGAIKLVLLALSGWFLGCAGLIHWALKRRPYALVWQKGPNDKRCVQAFDDLDKAKAAFTAMTNVEFKLLMDGTCSVVAAYGDVQLVNEAENRCYFGQGY